ncbi:hypothetical protein H6F74_27945 [Trichocoleus sp. FACHB-90]|nr:hypothetical protein [Trichocoleus sp. FACHB-90]
MNPSIKQGAQRKSNPGTQADAMRLGCDRGGAEVVPAIAVKPRRQRGKQLMNT